MPQKESETMILGMPSPTWKHLLGIQKKNNGKGFYELKYDHILWLAKSSMSIRLVIEAVKSTKKQNSIKVLVPDYFCYETISDIESEYTIIEYYPIDESFEPKWDYLKEWCKNNSFDVMIFTHYFGKYIESISRAKEICKSMDAILIEDCAHVLMPTGKMGTNGDFTILSPHKQLGVMDGAILYHNENAAKLLSQEVAERIDNVYSTMPQNHMSLVWNIKRGIQKIVPVHRSLKYFYGVHYGGKKEEKTKVLRCSPDSLVYLKNIQSVDMKIYASKRRRNLELMNYIITKLYPEVVPCLDSSINSPYMAAYSLKNVTSKEMVVNDMMKKGFILLFWPDLPHAIEEDACYESVKDMSKEYLFLPIHQGLRHQELIKKYL